MQVIYTFPLKKPFLLDDSWAVPFMDGSLRVISEGSKATAIEVTFAGKPVSLAPEITPQQGGRVKAHIQGRDTLFSSVRNRLESAFAFIECQFDVHLSLEEADIRYVGETAEEEELIDVKGFRKGKRSHLLPLSYDFFTRAIFTAERHPAPFFEATLISAARDALFAEKYIDSFRYSFLLLESLFGAGKFKKYDLERAFCKSAELVGLVSRAQREPTSRKQRRQSLTADLLSNQPSPELILRHLVVMRGFYFHGNRARKDAWDPKDQGNAEALALLAFDIVQLVGHEAAVPAFEEDLGARHFEDAKNAGATIVLDISFKFQESDESFVRDGQLSIRVPGTKATPRVALGILKQFLAQFEHGAPAAGLLSATCKAQETGEQVFDLNLHVRHPEVPGDQSSTIEQ